MVCQFCIHCKISSNFFFNNQPLILWLSP
jgi:hypothetical protein